MPLSRRNFLTLAAVLAPTLPAAAVGPEDMQLMGKHERFNVHRQQPFNGGPPLDLLRADFFTATDLFYVRNHAPVPVADADWLLEIDGAVQRRLSLDLATLQRDFPRHELAATMMCAGNRRIEMLPELDPRKAVAWGSDAISNGRWAGTRLRDVLAASGVTAGARHLAALGRDEIIIENSSDNTINSTIFSFGGSIPLQKALADEVLLAWELNGAPLTPLHGGPLRLLVPGYIGARSVKWLGRLTLQVAPSDNHFQQRAYKVFPPEVSADTVDWSTSEPLGAFEVNSAICTPAPDSVLPAGNNRISGYAISDAPVSAVELSVDGGRNWLPARLTAEQARWSWRFWEREVELAPGTHELVVRARNVEGNGQPPDGAPIYNFKGYMMNSWQRLRVTVR